MATETEFCLLGPLMVRPSGMVVLLSPGKQRTVLAALLLNADHVVSLDELAEILWGSSPPPSARVTMQNYVMRLRKALGSASSRISTKPRGYLIQVNADELDVSRFQANLDAACAAVRDRSWETAAAEARTGLALWRGEPLADVESELLATRDAPRLAELRLRALEIRIDADLHLGRHAEVIPELRHLADCHPLREHLHGQLMLALYRGDRQAEALATYQRARQILLSELGVEPGEGLRNLHQRILNADEALTVTGPARPGQAEPRRVMPRELPPTVPGFTGRTAELQTLTRMLDGPGERDPGTVVISAIGGTAGVGKTALAVHWAHQVAGRFPDGQLYVNLRGYDPGPPVPAAGALAGFLRSLGVPGQDIPPEADERAARYRSLLAGKRMLIVLDNARDTGQVRPLLPGTPGCLVLVTSRSQLAGLAVAQGASMLTLDVLTSGEADELLARRLGAERMNAEPHAVADLEELCARLPLALAITAARTAARPGRALAALAAELRDESGRLDALDTGDTDASVRAVFSWSCRHLGDPAARMFRLLGVHPGPDITAPAAASLAGIAPGRARRAIGELTAAHLITEHLPGRFAFHDLLRAYAAEQATARDSGQARGAAVQRMLDHYLHTAHAAALLLKPDREPLALPPPQPGVSAEPMTGGTEALAWFQAEHRLLLAAVTLAAGARYDAHAWQLTWTLGPFLYRWGYWQEWNTALASALTAAERLDDLTGQAQTHHYLGQAIAMLGSRQDAHGHLRTALDMFGQLGDRANQAHVHLHFGLILDRQNRYGDALTHDRQGLGLFRAIGHRAGEAAALNSVGWCLAHLGDCQQAVTWCQRALNLYREIPDPQSEADTWDSLGYAHHHLGHHAEAIDCYQRALSLYSQAGSRYYRTETLTKLGDTYKAAGNPHAARDAWRQAASILDDLHHPDAKHVNGKLSQLDTSTPPPAKS